MGFRITQTIDTVNFGTLTESYARIEMYRIDKVLGSIYTTVALYPSYEAAQTANSPYVDENGSFLLNSFSYSENGDLYHGNVVYASDSGSFTEVQGNYTSSIIATAITYNGNSFDYPTYLRFPVTSSVTVNIPVYQDQLVSQSVNYFDFDETGSIVTKTRIDYVSQSVQIGTQDTTYFTPNVALITGSTYQFAYDNVKTVYSGIFGSENIIDN